MSSGKKLALRIFLAVYVAVMVFVLVFGNMKMRGRASLLTLFDTATDPASGKQVVATRHGGKEPVLAESIAKLKDVRLAEDYVFAGPPAAHAPREAALTAHVAELAAAVNAGAPNEAWITGEANVVGFDLTLILIALNFLGLLGSLYLLLWDPILAALDNRSATIRTELETARAARTQADELLARYNTQLEDARQQRQKLIGDGRDEGTKERERIIAEARREAEQLLERGRQNIETEMAGVRTSVTRQLGGLAVDLAERILQREVKEADQTQLVEQFLCELEAEKKA
jgi:F-type H+-transporting ATPase subunit b